MTIRKRDYTCVYLHLFMVKSRSNTNRIAILAILLLAFALRVAWLTRDRFHADEALYAGWALRILDDDPLLLDEPVDKPPLFLYTLAGAFRLFGSSECLACGEVAARWVNLACSMIGIALIYRMPPLNPPCVRGGGNPSPPLPFPPANGGDRGGAAWAAFFLACSPFDILFARTAFTDLMLVMCWLGALLAAARGRWFWAGLLSGLAFATKQHAVMLIPLVVVVGYMAAPPSLPPRRRGGLRGGVGFLLPWSLATWWDSARWAIRPGYWDQSALSYGGLVWAPIAQWPARLVDWLGWARYLTGGWTLGLAFVIGVIGLLIVQRQETRVLAKPWFLEALWVLFTLCYLVLHIVFNFSVWDRYLLPLAAPTALLGAQIIQRVGHACSVTFRSSHVKNVSYGVTILIALAVGLRAAFNGYPVGGEHWAYQGIDRVAAYLKANAAPDAVLYHHWLRWHYTYYLHGADFELRWWQDGAHLRQEAGRTDPAREQYIVLPDWRPLDPAIEGVRFDPVLAAEQLTLYRVAVVP